MVSVLSVVVCEQRHVVKHENGKLYIATTNSVHATIIG